MNIGKAAELSNLSVKTVRYYANIGLVTAKKDYSSGYRVYNDENIEKLIFIGKARKFNFSIQECRELLGLYENKDRSSSEVKKLTLKKITEIQNRMSELNSLQEELGRLAMGCNGDHRPNCPIIGFLAKKDIKN